MLDCLRLLSSIRIEFVNFNEKLLHNVPVASTKNIELTERQELRCGKGRFKCHDPIQSYSKASMAYTNSHQHEKNENGMEFIFNSLVTHKNCNVISSGMKLMLEPSKTKKYILYLKKMKSSRKVTLFLVVGNVSSYEKNKTDFRFSFYYSAGDTARQSDHFYVGPQKFLCCF